MSKLFLVRHGKSEWNELGLWTGWTDVELHPDGILEATKAGRLIAKLRNIEIHGAHVSDLKRAKQTLEYIKTELSNEIPTKSHHALNERNYGIYTGKSKSEVMEEIGEEAFTALRRGWDVSIDQGESLKDVYERVVPYFKEFILPDLRNNMNLLVVAHGNSLRALMKNILNISDTAIRDLEIGTGEVHCYDFNSDGEVIGKDILSKLE